MAERMRGLTLHRPWDTAMLVLGKPLENRSWSPPAAVIGQRIALHSGKTWDGDGVAFITGLAVSNGMAPREVLDFVDRARDVHSAIIGTVKISRVLRRGDLASMSDPLYSSPWFFGDCGWVREDAFLLPEPVPCKGMQGLWTVPADVAERVRAQEAARG